jgi:predicted secreted protein
LFNDKRSKKVVFVSHCILNQNPKLDACAHYPGTIKETAEVLLGADIGIVQMPCPEFLYLGLDRGVDYGTNPSVESEDTRIAVCMNEEKSKCLCTNLVHDIVYQIEEYQKFGFNIVGLIGINGSPTCGVETTWYGGGEHQEPGIFIKMLGKELKKKSINIKMVGIKAMDAKEAVTKTKKLLGDG